MGKYVASGLVGMLGIMLLAGCASSSSDLFVQTPAPVVTLAFNASPISAPTGTPPATATPVLTATPLFGPTSTLTPSPTPFGCGPRPIDDARRVPVREWVITERTLAMLSYAQSIYGGPNDLLLGLTQGSYNSGVEGSFGTHDGGGVVDLSIYNQGPEAGLLDQGQVQELVLALRRAGFAAWQRALDDLYSGSPPHIHAVAIGDRDLSHAAEEQLTGPYGYFRGGNGLPDERGGPDQHGGPIVCPWMVEMGYANLVQD